MSGKYHEYAGYRDHLKIIEQKEPSDGNNSPKPTVPLLERIRQLLANLIDLKQQI